MRRQKVIVVLLVATMAMSLTGCGKKEDTSEPQAPTPSQAVPQAPAETPAPAQATVPVVEDVAAAAEIAAKSARFLGEVFVSWNMGKKDAAVQQFLAIQWDDPAAFQGIPMLVMSEQQLTSLSQEQRNRIVQETQGLSAVLRSIATHVIAAGETQAAAGDADNAKAHFDAVRQCGQALKSPDRLQVVQVVGKAMVQLAQEKLTAEP